MDLSFFGALLEGIKQLPESLAGLLILVSLVISYFFKSKGQEHQQVTEVSKLQSDQLKTLIEQNEKLMQMNSTLAQQLHATREEISEAYTIIEDLKLKLARIQRLLQEKGISYGDSTTGDHRN
jgi:ribosome assembly protein YihI (activator of Der GTPase)